MRKLLWLLSAIALWTVTPAAQAQFGPRYGPRATRPYAPGIHGVRDPFGAYDPFGPRLPGVSGMPWDYDPLGFSGFPMGRQPWLPPTPQDIINDALAGRSGLSGYSGPPVFHPLAPYRGQNDSRRKPNTSVNPLFQPDNVPPLSIQTPNIDPKMFENLHTIHMKDFEAKPPAKAGGGGPPEWLRWEYAVGIFVLAAIGGLLHALTRSKTSES